MAEQEYIDENKNACPYCGKALLKVPAKDSPCPYCGNIIYVRQSRYSKDKILTTGDKVDMISGGWKDGSFVKSILRTLRSNGVKESDFYNQKKSMIGLDGKEPNDIEVLRVILNDLQKKNINVYFQMAMLLNMEKKDTYGVLSYAKKLELTNLKNSGIVKKVKISIGAKPGEPEPCEICKKQIGRVYTIDEALQKMPLPCKNCNFKLYDESRGFCRCIYIAAF